MSKSWSACVVMAAAYLVVLGSAVRVDAAPKKKPGAAKNQKKHAAKGIPNKSFDELDRDKNGFLSMSEIFGKQQKKGSPARKAFDRADKDRNDWLDRQEFQVLKRSGIHGGGRKGAAKKGGKKGPGAQRGAKKGTKKKGGKKRRKGKR